MSSPALGSYILGSTRTLKSGVTGPDVADLQTILNLLNGGERAKTTVNSIYGSETINAVRAFQTACGIGVDGLFGKDSRTALAALWNAAASGAPAYGGYGPAAIQRLRTAVGAMSPVAESAVVPGNKLPARPTVQGPAFNPTPSMDLAVPGSAAAIPGASVGASIWKKAMAPVTLPFVKNVTVPRWSIVATAFGVTGALFLGLKSLTRRR